MRHAAVSAIAVLAFALGAAAQDAPSTSEALISAQSQPLPAAPVLAAAASAVSSAALPGEGADPQRSVYVRQPYRWESYIGYTFVGFHAYPGYTANRNGFNYSFVYCFTERIGADGEFVFTHGSQNGQASRFVLGMGGARFRWYRAQRLDLWLHALAGGAEYTPQTLFGGQKAFGYELGGGADFNFRPRLGNL